MSYYDFPYTGDEINEILHNVPKKLSDLEGDSSHQTVTSAEKSTWNNKSNFSGSYNDLTDKPTIPPPYQLPVASESTLGGIKVGSGLSISNGVLSTSEVTPTWDEIQDKPEFADVATSGSYTDLSNTPSIPSALADLSDDSTHRIVTDTEKTTWNNKSDFSGNYSDLSGKPSIPTKTSDLTNDSGFVEDSSYVHTDNNYTNAEKSKLSGIASGAEVNVQSDWNVTDNTSDAYIKNKPTIPSPYELPTASASTLGGIKVGTGLAIENGVLSTTGGGGSQDAVLYTEQSLTSEQQAQARTNIGAGTSSLVIDSSHKLSADLVQDGTTNKAYTATEQSKLSGIESGAQVNVKPDWNASAGAAAEILNKPTIPAAQVNSDWNSSSGVSQILNKPNLATVATSGSYDDLQDKPTIPDAQIQSDYGQTNSSSVDYIKNKPDLSIYAQSSNLATVATSGDYDDLLNKPTIPPAYELPKATTTTLGGVIVGTGLTVDSDGTIAVTGSGQSVEWNDVANKPSTLSGYGITDAKIESGTITLGSDSITPLTAHQDISGKADKVSGGTENNFAALDSNGNLKDSGHKHGDYQTLIDSSHKLSADLIEDGTTNKVINVKPNWNASSGDAAEILNKPTLGNAAAKDYTSSVTDGSSDLVTSGAVYTAIDNLPNPMVFKGSLGSSGGTITSLPVDGTATVGDTYKVITAGTYASQAADVGDTFICDSKTSNANTWVLIPSGDEPSGTVTSAGVQNATNGGLTISGSPITSSGTITIGHSNVITAGTASGSATKTLDFGDTFEIPSVTYDANGHITAKGSSTMTMPANPNTDTATAADDILDGSNSGTQITYAPYSSQQNKLSFDTSSTAPSGTDRLNLNGYLWATKLYSGGSEVLTSHQSLSNYVTLDGDQNITGIKTFVGQKRIAFKQSGSTDKLGFTLYNNSGTEKGYLEFNASNTVDSVPLMTLGNYASAAAGLTHVGFRKYSSISGASGAYNLLTPLISDARTPFSLTTTYTNFYLPLGFTDGTTTVKTAKTGLVDLSSILPSVSGKADKVSSATNGNFAGLDSNGNLTDSGKKASDFQTALSTQTAYTSKGSATKVPQITTNTLGQVTGITEVTITQPDVSNFISKSNTAGLVKNDGTIDTNTYLTSAPVTSVNGQTGAVSLNIPSVNDSTITLQANGSQVDTFTTNASSAKTINLGNYLTSTTAGLKIEVVSALPASPDSNTIYIVQGS